MAGAQVTVVGFDELAEGSTQLYADLVKRAEVDLAQVAGRRGAMVRTAVPHVTGRLADSIAGHADPQIHGATLGIGGPGVPYAGWIEFGGTRGRDYIPRGRYLYPIAFAAGSEVKREATISTTNEIKGFRWKKPKPRA
jgi:hypothetical protein